MFRIPKEENYEADIIAKLIATAKMLKNVLVETVEVPSTEKIIVVALKEKED